MAAGNGSTALTRVEGPVPLAEAWNAERVELLRKTIAPRLTHDELELFVEVCKSRQLDPFTRQIYANVRGRGDDRKVSFETSIDGFRITAARTGKYEGQLGPFWCGSDGKWVDVWLGADVPVAAKVGVVRAGFREPLWAVAKTLSYRPVGEKEQFMWRRMPEVMIAKCAEALALRKAFPEQLSGIYTSDEMAQADRPIATTAATEDGEVLDEAAVERALDAKADELLARVARATRVKPELMDIYQEVLDGRLGKERQKRVTNALTKRRRALEDAEPLPERDEAEREAAERLER